MKTKHDKNYDKQNKPKTKNKLFSAKQTKNRFLWRKRIKQFVKRQFPA